MRYTEASQRLREWLLSEQHKVPDIAKVLKVDRSSVYRWRRGAGRPDALTAHRLQVLSQGGVPARLWYPEMRGAV